MGGSFLLLLLVPLAWFISTLLLLFDARRNLSRRASWIEFMLGSTALIAAGMSALDETPGPSRFWGMAGMCGCYLAALLWVRWNRFCHGRFAVTFVVDFACTAAQTAALCAALLQVSARLFRLHPFPALVLGILSLFLPVNALAEVFRAGAAQRRRS